MRKKKTEMESQDKRYMLFIFGDFTEMENFINDISYQLVTVISSKFLKFNYGEFGMTLHFRTKETFEDLKEYVDMCLEDLVEQYFLIEATENVDIKMDRKLKKDFLNIDGDTKKEETKTGTINVDTVINERREELKNFTFEFLMPEDFIPLNQMMNAEIEYPTVDEILDKISEKGIETLTEKEKEILDNYGKRKNGGH